MKKRTGFNQKRKFRAAPLSDQEQRELLCLVTYGGNPEHKRNPGDFGLTPPSQPRADKTLCDTAGIFSRKLATELLRRGIERGMLSKRQAGDFPQNIWSVTDAGMPLEAQLENQDLGTYHGYPMPESDPFRSEVLDRWKRMP
jgi:hypothetical protein